MKYEILDSVRMKRTLIELWMDGWIYYVAKIVGERVTFLFHSTQYEIANKFYERKIGG